jgi:RNase P subunit RPR2
MQQQATYRASSQIDNSIKPFRCPVCRSILGETNGTSLRIGGVIAFPFVVTGVCLACGAQVKWRPVNDRNGGCA